MKEIKERMERLLQIAKERDELHEHSAWWELKQNLKYHATNEEVDMIDRMWNLAEAGLHLDHWDEDFLLAVSGEYKTQKQRLDEMNYQFFQQQQLQQAQLQRAQAQAQSQSLTNPYQNAGLLGGLKGLLGGK
jgi:hypothetical protein